MYSMMPAALNTPGENRMRLKSLVLGLLLALPATAALGSPAPATPPLAVPGLAESHLAPEFWLDTLAHGDRVVLDRAAIDAQNARMVAGDPSIHDLSALPARIDGARVRDWIEGLASLPTQTVYDEHGAAVAADVLAGIGANTNLDQVPADQATRYGMVLRRADLRAFPTALRVFRSAGDSDIDRFQESALFPGDPVAVLHESADGEWLFVLSQRYAAWIRKEQVAEGGRDQVLDWGDGQPYLVVTGATATTVHTPEAPQVSGVQLEMGVRVPRLADWPANRQVNGQMASAGYVIELPVRGDDGRLAFAPALLPRSADVSDDYLPLTEANLVRQSFKFLGERYGWGHSYNTRDCSGFVSEVYRSFGVLLPRNTSAQSVTPVLNRLELGPNVDHEARVQALREARTGDLVYIPGHVMMVLGHVDGEPVAIHDTSGMSWLPEGAGELQRLHLNGVVVTPILPMMSNATTPTVDRITAIQRIRP